MLTRICDEWLLLLVVIVVDELWLARSFELDLLLLWAGHGLLEAVKQLSC